MRITHIVHGDPHARKRPLLFAMLGGIALTLGAALVTAQATTRTTTHPVEFNGPIIDGSISSHYGQVRTGISERAHNGIDLKARRGTAVNAPAAGTVSAATTRYQDQPRYGTVIVLDHGDGWQTLYAHLDSFDVAVGDRVVSGQRIGRVGSTGQATGSHVHVEVFHEGARVDPASVISNLVAAK
jgi:murein DD-endopeptidase MepM/ murein hydrolase activator NlpD